MEKKHVKTLSSATLKESAAKGGCGNVTSANQLAKFLTVANQSVKVIIYNKHTKASLL